METIQHKKFTPDKELLDFAESFSKIYKKSRGSFFISKNKKYQIRYLSRIPKTNTCVRIGTKTGIIEMDKTLLKAKAYTPDFVFFMVLWCIACKEQNGDFAKSDIETIKYYQTTDRSIKNIFLGYLHLFSKTINVEFNKNRYIALRNYILKHE